MEAEKGTEGVEEAEAEEEMEEAEEEVREAETEEGKGAESAEADWKWDEGAGTAGNTRVLPLG